MSTQTTKLQLLKGAPNDVIDFVTFLNGNWDKIDALFGAINGFATLGADGKITPAQLAAGLMQAVSGGYKVQSGIAAAKSTAAGSFSTWTVYFPQIFSSPPVLLLTLRNGMGASKADYGISSVDADNAVIFAINNDTAACNLTIHWVAIGN